MKLKSPLFTPRLLMRTMTSADVSDTYLLWMHDPEVTRFLECRFSNSMSMDKLVSYIESINVSNDTLILGIYLRSDCRHIGNIKIGPILSRHLRAEIGYMIGDRLSWGKGYATEAIREICRYCFSELGLAKITAGVYETNIGSAKALLNAGFDLEATIPSHVICDGHRIASMIYGLHNIDL